jgi:2C-methyl-D-erythritol 2,4-cyclodiphosphate synthase
VLKIPIDKISIKAKTAEGLGPVGEEAAVEAHAVALIDL